MFVLKLKNPIAKISHHRLDETFTYIDETIAMSAMYAANHMGARVISTLTEGVKPLYGCQELAQVFLL